MTAASYGKVDMVQALIAAGADLEATGFAVPGGTALTHAVEFGNTEVVDLLADAGAVVHAIIEAAGVGNLDGYDLSAISLSSRARAARAAAVCERLDVLDQLIASGVPVDGGPTPAIPDGSRTLLHEAAYWGKFRSAERLVALGADPNRRDAEHHSTPLGWCLHRLAEITGFGDPVTAGHLHVERILESITKSD